MSYALITGPTAGIGKALAYQLAEKGYNLLLVARREDRLIQISEDIKDKFNVEVLFIVEDLTNSLAPERIYDFTVSKALDIELLILNAGYQHHRTFEEVSISDEEDCLRVLGLSVIMQSKLFIN